MSVFIPFIAPILEILKRVIPDADERLKIEAQLEAAAAEADGKFVEAQSKVIVAEAEGNVFQRSWRPLLMYFLMLIVFWHVFLLPFVAMWAGSDLNSLVGLNAMPDEVWYLLIVGMGGYIGARTLEKIKGVTK
jgi:hypothetical protein